MRAVMYHYVRTFDPNLPGLRFLHLDDFVRQLDWFEQTSRFVGREEFDAAIVEGRSPEGVVLTFDDALADHAHVVLPVLADRGLWGIFYVPTAPYRSGRPLDVHRVHVLTARYSGSDLLGMLEPLVEDEMLEHRRVREFRELTYGRLGDDDLTDTVKRILNYFIRVEHRGSVLDELCDAAGLDDDTMLDQHYATEQELRAMHEAGMIIGSHGHSHSVMSALTPVEQHEDLLLSMSTLRSILDAPVETYCHPFGGFHTFDDATERILDQLGVRYAFNVEPRDVVDEDLRLRPLALPRHDCNRFPHGRARVPRIQVERPSR